MGTPGSLSYALCQEMKAALREGSPEEEVWLTPPAAEELDALRRESDGLVEPGATALEETPDSIHWHTFGGGRANRVLAAALEATAGQKWRAGNLGLRVRDLGGVEAREAVEELRGADLDAIAAAAADGFVRGELSKFQVCLPERAERALLVDRVLEVEGARAVLRSSTVRVVGEPR